jgi:hypothetical protein
MKNIKIAKIEKDEDWQFTDNDYKHKGLRKIGELPESPVYKYIKEDRCLSDEHNPPRHVVLEPGIYEYECPQCHKKTVFRIQSTF